MLQRATHLHYKIAGCPGCRRQPLHVHHVGKDRHSMECPPCVLRTPPALTKEAAIAAWESIAALTIGAAA